MNSHLAKEDYAKENWVCPIARTFGDQPKEKCRGSSCPGWRWKPLAVSEPGYKEAVNKVMQKKADGGMDLPHTKAAKYVNEHRSEFGLPEAPYLGWCGFGGKPEA